MSAWSAGSLGSQFWGSGERGRLPRVRMFCPFYLLPRHRIRSVASTFPGSSLWRSQAGNTFSPDRDTPPHTRGIPVILLLRGGHHLASLTAHTVLHFSGFLVSAPCPGISQVPNAPLNEWIDELETQQWKWKGKGGFGRGSEGKGDKPGDKKRVRRSHSGARISTVSDGKDEGTKAGRRVGRWWGLFADGGDFEVKQSIQVKDSGPGRWNRNPMYCCGQQKCQQNIAVHHHKGCWKQSRKYLPTNFCTWKSIYSFGCQTWDINNKARKSPGGN